MIREMVVYDRWSAHRVVDVPRCWQGEEKQEVGTTISKAKSIHLIQRLNRIRAVILIYALCRGEK